MNQVTETETVYKDEDIHRMAVELLAGVMGDDHKIVKAVKNCGGKWTPGEKRPYCGKENPITRMLCPYCHRMRHRLAQSLFLLGCCRLKATRKTTFYDIVVTPHDPVSGEFTEILDTLKGMLDGLEQMGFSFLAFQELVWLEGEDSYWPHLHVIANGKIEETPKPAMPDSEYLASLKPYEYKRAQAYGDWQRYNAHRYNYDYKYQEPHSPFEAFDRLNYVAKPLTRSWIRTRNGSQNEQKLRFLMIAVEELNKQMQMIRSGGAFHFPGLYDIDMDDLLNNHEINRSVNKKSRSIMDRGKLLNVLLAYWLELAKGYESRQIIEFLRMETKARRMREWKRKFSDEALALLVRAKLVRWKQPNWKHLGERDRQLIRMAIDKIERKEIDRQTKLSRTQGWKILKKYDLSTEGKRRLAKVILASESQ